MSSAPGVLITACAAPLVKRLRATFGGRYTEDGHDAVRQRSRALIADRVAIVTLALDEAGEEAAELAWWLGRMPTIRGVVIVAAAPAADDSLVTLADVIRPAADGAVGPEVIPDLLTARPASVRLAALSNDCVHRAALWLSRRFGPHQIAALAIDPARRPQAEDHRALRSVIACFEAQLA